MFIPTLEHDFPDSLIVSIDVEKHPIYEKLIEEIDSISCTEKIPFIEIETDSTIFNLLAYHICSKEQLIADYKTRNIIGINNDSIVINKDLEFDINSLETILKKQYLNFGKDEDFAISPEKAVLFFYNDLDTNNKIVKKRLLRIINRYLSISKNNTDSIKLRIAFEFYPLKFVEAPPLPKK